MTTTSQASAISEVDEASAGALLKQAAAGISASNQPAMQQKVIQPLGGVFGSSSSRPTPTSSSPLSVPTRQSTQPPSPPPAEPDDSTSSSSPVEPESATIEPTDTPEDERTIYLGGGDDNSNETVISLH
jgi:hypothetical protein